MKKTEIKRHSSVAALLSELHARRCVVVEKAEFGGLVVLPSGEETAYILLQDEQSLQTFPYAVDNAQLVRLAKETLRYLDPAALDPEDQLHEKLHRIDERTGKILSLISSDD